MTPIAMASVSERPMTLRILAAAALLAFVGFAQERLTAIRVARAWTVTGKPIDDAVVLIEGGRIVKVGAASETPIPEMADVLEGAGWHLTPGFIHPYASGFGISSGDLGGTTSAADRQVSGDVKPQSWDVIAAAAKAGFTRLNLLPINGGVTGQGVFVAPAAKADRDPRVEDILGAGSTSLAMGFDPKTSTKKFFREILGKAQKYRDDLANPKKPSKSESKPESGDSKSSESKASESKPSEPSKDPKVMPLVDVMEKRLPGFLGIRAPHGLLHFQPIMKEFPAFRPILCLGPECWRSVELVKELGVPVVLTTGSVLKADTDIEIPTPVRFFDAGIPVALIPENPAPGFTGFAFHLSEVVRRGVSRDDVLRSVTMVPAEMLGVQKDIGALGAGMSADLLLWSGDPFVPSSKLLRVMVRGTTVHDATEAP